MKWKFVKGKDNLQEDEVGNIFQRGGGVQPKRCQKCKKEFNSVRETIPIKENIPSYKCDVCPFDGDSGDQAFNHMLDFPSHKISKGKKFRIVGYNNVLTGTLPYIKILEDDVAILCGECNGK